jgi:SAM-dependent methyltransferase
MDSKEFGLVAAQQLFQIQDLHYGFWEEGEIPSIRNFLEAQNKHTLFLFKYIEEAINADRKCKILDTGCGIGKTTTKLLEAGYRVDGLVPSSWMAQQARKNTERYKDKTRGEIYECGFEDFPTSPLSEKYTLVFFSESYQYVNMQKAFDKLNLILSKTGTVIIFDFFGRDEVTGESPLGGGHSIGQFYETVKRNGYTIHTDLDVTDNLSPNLKLVNDILVNRVIPFSNTLDAFLSARFKFLYKLLKYMFRKKLEKIKYKYSQSRNEENFRKFKTYRLFVLKRT